MTRVLVTGGRHFTYRQYVFRRMALLAQSYKIAVIIHGAASGADRLAAEWAKSVNIPTLPFQADWRNISHPKAKVRMDSRGIAYDATSGIRRNQTMLDVGRPDLVIAFPGGPGTADMVQRAKKAGIPVLIAAEMQDAKSAG